MYFNKVTRFSIILAVVLYAGTFVLAFCLGFWSASVAVAPTIVAPSEGQSHDAGAVITSATFACDGGKTIQAVFFSGKVELMLSDKRSFLLNQGISGSGARYATGDESLVFWNKGTTAFIQEGSATTYQNCVTKGQ
jgi:membrane-bound inhibitor of C-type lysozyme